MVRDLTEEKRQAVRERGARETIELLSQAVEQTGDSIMITTPGGVIEYVNAGFEDISGYSREEAVGNSPNILRSGVHDKDFYTAMWKQILAGETFRGTLANRKKSGELYWCQQTITPIRDSAGRTSHFVSVLKDITQLRRQQEQDLRMHLAREVQQHFYEGASARVAGFEIGIAACPAHETGGDYLDVFPLPDGRICIGIGDVSGHGLDSALMMALTRAYVRAFSYVEGDPARLLSSVNRMLVHDLPNDRYVTLLLVCLDAKNNSLTYASAGHIPAFLMSDSGEIDSTLESSGVPLGLFAEAQFLTTTVPIRHHQTLILLTDGITEATAQQEDVQFGSQRAVEYVRAHQSKSARELADGICAAAREFTTGQVQFDDLTNVVVKVA
jgi:sigma-B regulation protein RsbU (phosphoserine phosphatase)